MGAIPSRRRRPGWVVLLAVGLAGCAPLRAQPPEPQPAAARPPVAVEAPAGRSTAAPEVVAGYRSPRDVAAVAEPTRVRIPAIGVDSGLDRLGRNPDGTVEVPDDFARAGWYTPGARPGQRGPAVVLGHVDSRAGPAVFYRLVELEAGDEVLVDRRDGSTATFVIDRVEHHAKDAFPSEEVYFPTLEPRLALVTCGGEFDRTAGSYRDNVIAFASLKA